MRSLVHLVSCVTAMAIAVTWSAHARADDSDAVTWVVQPYLWAPSIKGDLDLKRTRQPRDTTATFSDILDKITAAAQVHIEAQGNTFGMLADVLYLGMKNDRNKANYATKSSFDTTIAELAFVWSPEPDRFNGFETIAGIRTFHADADFKLVQQDTAQTRTRIKMDGTWNDAMMGARYSWTLSPHWAATIRVDGGFGDTDTNYNGSIMARYRTNGGAWSFGYRYMDTKFERAGRTLDVKLYGPEVAYAFVF